MSVCGQSTGGYPRAKALLSPTTRTTFRQAPPLRGLRMAIDLAANPNQGLVPRQAWRLVARTVRRASLDQATIAEAFALFDAHYAGADRARFERDLSEKQLVILLRDATSNALKGFSTVLVQKAPDGQPGTVVFSGDTVIDRNYWGQKQLQTAFARVLLTVKLRSPTQPVYWFLISKGYRTYLLLANNFPISVPRTDRADDSRLSALLDGVATARFGAQYEPATRIVRLDGAHDRVREGTAPVTAELLENAHVRFFVERNPGHASGDELACLARVRLRDVALAVCRIVLTRFARSLGIGSQGAR